MKQRLLLLLCSVFLILVTGAAVAEDTTNWFEKGIIAEREMKYLLAIEAYSRAIERNPAFAAPYLQRAKLIFRFNPSECVGAFMDLSKAIGLEPDNADALYLRGLVNYYMMNNEMGKMDMELAAALGHEKAVEFLHPGTNPSKKNAVFFSFSKDGAAGKPALIHFDVDKAEIKKSYARYLDEVASSLAADSSGVIVFVAGHADCTGSDEYNDGLSLRRAEAVQSYICRKSGVSPDRVIVKAYGELQPIASNDSTEGRALNRRVDLIGIKK